jgi:hypothetical protein
MKSKSSRNMRFSINQFPRRILFSNPDVLAVGTLTVGVIIFSIIAEGFLTIDNIRSIFASVAVFACLALGENLVILAREIDVSIGSILALAGFVAGDVANATGSLLLTCLTGIGVGLIAGIINGLVVVHTPVPSIVVTLGTLYVFQGVALLISHSRNITMLNPGTEVLGSGNILGFPRAAFVVLIAFLCLRAVRRNTNWGRDLLATGSNRSAASMMGVPIKRQLLTVFALSGALTGLGAVIYIGQLGGMLTSVTQSNTVLQVIAACAIGGTSIAGGRGSDLSPITGALIIGMITAGVVLLGVPSVWISCAYGGCILIAVARDRFQSGSQR